MGASLQSSTAGAALDCPKIPGSIALVGPFDPAAISTYMTGETGARIAHIRSAPGVPIHSLAEALAKRGIRTTLVGGVRDLPAVCVHSDPLSVVLYPKRGARFYLLNGLHRERMAALAILRKVDPAVVHAHWTFEAGRAVADWQGPKLLTIHDAAWEYARLGLGLHPGSVAFAARWLSSTAATLNRMEHLVAVSPFIETYLRVKHRYRGEIRVIPNAVPPLPADLILPRCFPKGDSVTFACYGEPGGIKNVHVAIKAFQRLRRKLPDSRLLVFGKGWERLRWNVADPHIEFRGAIPHAEFLRCLVTEVDVWTHTSRIEAHGLAICEALQAGCVVIGGRQSGAVAWTLNDGDAGFLVDIDDAKAVADTMLEAVTDRTGAQQKVASGRRSVAEICNPQRILDMHLEYYGDVVQSHARKRMSFT